MSKQSEAQWLTERARSLHALSCLMQLVVAARAQTDIVTWQKVGGLEAENFLDALEHGLPHPLLATWEDVRAGNNRPGPSLRERQFRRLAVLLSVTLQAAKVPKRVARKRTVKALAHLFPITSHRSIEHWELGLDPPLDAEDQKVIKAALERLPGSSARATGLMDRDRSRTPIARSTGCHRRWWR
jgi:hypothetical protein